MNAQSSTLTHQAKQGNAEAIAALMNRHLEPKGIIAKAVLQNGLLLVTLEGSETPNQSQLFPFVKQGISGLRPQFVHRVKLMGQVKGEALPVWTEEFGFPTQTASLVVNADIQQLVDNDRSSITNFSQTSTVSILSEIDSAKPKNYLIPSILVTLFAFLPVGIAALIFASQVDSKYGRKDYIGAQVASKTAKALCIVAGAIAAPVYTLVTISIGAAIILPSILYAGQATKGKQSEARQYIGTLARTQQAHYLTVERFAQTLTELSSPIPTETTNYSYSVSVIDNTAVHLTATAKTSGLKSYAAAVYAVKDNISGETNTITKTCESDRPSQSAPAMPQLVGSTILCAPNSSEMTLKQ
ncbi:type IV pilin-like G/H family protein [Leptolyngbya sp. NIES-2104]|uniref:type IV pilin-like G/H family protein n=1 Tax=Leptolyngbya sp. NIES-2104 TaxID=1552121 RepID=UPI0006EC4AAC|nr:type IV pilin-like G/H family protein [Leptolyngbya sp. NIES-2104]GAP96009.1 type IV pilin PilA [Leptolyngbya sp. NIES-2104]